ncbi:Cell surface GPI-anchored protein [Lasiodiplodia hormozganensis]|uniref:Cell surface GPI-anchored protein n=1 Tax=Lasiodiplodia hormozganensis TaxID=869390 RepID=A0AA39XTV3_9PEZI|nr:Cell surface GPI-anchored protein [Lasiodiplodia hormozganensis]
MAAQNWFRAAIVSSVCLGLASAADSCTGTTTVSSKADATSLASACKTYSGTVAVATGTSDEIDLEIEKSSFVVANTKLTSLEGGADDAVLENINVSSNSDLEDITFEGTHASNITIGANSAKAEISFPHLKEAVDIEIANASSIDLAALESLPRGALHIYGGDLSKLDLAEFREVSDGLILEDLPKLTELSAPEFTRIMDRGALTISNTGLTELSLPKLQLVFSSLYLSGDFKTVDLPLLTSVGGDIYMKGASDFDCDAFSKQFKEMATDNGKTFKCVAGDDSDDSDAQSAKPSSSSTFSSASASGSSSSSSTASSTASGTSSGASSTGTAASASGSATPSAAANDNSSAAAFKVGMATLGGVFGLLSFLLC